jgi:arylsulfatase A-like enzyme
VLHAGVSERFGTEREIDRYDGEIAFTDRYVGEVLRRLDALGLGQDTVVVVTADHGEEFGEHGFTRHGYSLYEPAVRIPLVVRAPGLPPRRVPDVVSNVDLMPTLLDLAGVRLERVAGASCEHPLEGRSLALLLRGATLPPREAVSEVRWHEGQDMRGVLAERWKYLEHRVGGKDEDLLFDLGSDPGETRSVLDLQAARTSALRQALLHRLGRALGWAKCYPLHEPYAPSPGDLQRLQQLGYAGSDGTAPPPQEGHK